MKVRYGTLKRPLNLTWQPGTLLWTVYVDAGIRVKYLSGRWVLDEFPVTQFPYKSIQRHDAIHYGITVQDDAVLESNTP